MGAAAHRAFERRAAGAARADGSAVDPVPHAPAVRIHRHRRRSGLRSGDLVGRVARTGSRSGRVEVLKAEYRTQNTGDRRQNSEFRTRNPELGQVFQSGRDFSRPAHPSSLGRRSVICVLCPVSCVLCPVFCVLCSVFCVLCSVSCVLYSVS